MKFHVQFYNINALKFPELFLENCIAHFKPGKFVTKHYYKSEYEVISIQIY